MRKKKDTIKDNGNQLLGLFYFAKLHQLTYLFLTD